ncbi:DUF5787 family protein [Natronobiforma cellulositropha]|uniref:DUF5787 family protein n=1 Tax=Natronobiforma cellulositropha TaxID=1679076 RepID=UPI0021D5C020|nr:DUF5787 family protein [Natronobiforma cellulositropha]
MREFAFELRLCAALERRLGSDTVVARQLGASVANPGGRIVDVLCVHPGPEFAARTALTDAAIPAAAIESRVGTGRARFWKDAFDCHPRTARRATDRALEIGFFERERRGGRDYVRQRARYPDWFGRLVAIENKPDLARPGDLEGQLRTDVSLALADEVILATESYVTGAHLNRIPEVVGVWRFHPERVGDASADGDPIEVIREPTPLPVERPGTEPLESYPGRTDVAFVSSERKARARRRLAERAYGKGWRTYAFPACAVCETDASSGATLPHCPWAGSVVDAGSDCGTDCAGYEPGEERVSAADLESEREARTGWVRDPAGPSVQSGLDRFL